MGRFPYIALGMVALAFLTYAGCKADVSPGVDVVNATQVSFDQFKDATKDEVVFWYLGRDADSHYFRTKHGFYRISIKFEIFDQSRLERAKRNFEEGIPVGEQSQIVMIHGDKLGAPSNGVDRNISYPPLD